MRQRNSMKPVGAWEVRRSIPVPALSHDADAKANDQALAGTAGVLKAAVDAGSGRVSVLYDATAADYESIVEALEQAGFPPSDSGWSRFKARWYQYSDSTARENAGVRPSACCNKPPK